MKHLLHLYTNQRLCIMGDMNEDLFSHHSKPITTMFTAKNMKQHVYTATHDSGTLIDHVYTNNITESMYSLKQMTVTTVIMTLSHA